MTRLDAAPAVQVRWTVVLVEVVAGVLVTLLAVALLTMASGRPMRAGATMAPSIRRDAIVWVGGGAPTRGAVMVLAPDIRWRGVTVDEPGPLTRAARWLRLDNPPDGSRVLVRVIGMPGDVVVSDGRAITVNDLDVPAVPIQGHRFRVVVPQGRHFVMTDRPSAMSSACYLSALGADALVPTDHLVGRVRGVGQPWTSRSLTQSASPYTGIAGRAAPTTATVDAGKDPTC